NHKGVFRSSHYIFKTSRIDFYFMKFVIIREFFPSVHQLVVNLGQPKTIFFHFTEGFHTQLHCRSLCADCLPLGYFLPFTETSQLSPMLLTKKFRRNIIYLEITASIHFSW
ncbi:MAG: hypothetical protein LBF88_03735, partial [Planctomycetaceae bacterium]|nr:hypothetical protein [Planctomycetaceae bacterium]